MEFRLLGQFELRDGTRTHHLGGPMQRTLLAHLLLAGQDPRTTDDLVERLWGATATDGSTSTLQVHVLRLRRLLKATGCTTTIETTNGAYRMRLGDDTTDIAEFRRLLDEAATARDAGDRFAELTALNAALALWHGEPLASVTGDWPRFAEVQHLLDAHDQAREHRAEVQIALRRPDHAVPDLKALVAEHPDRERARHTLMRALHQAGRRAEALAVYDEAYRFAVDELGLEPGTELRELQQQILRGTTEAHALPLRSPVFVGRAEELAVQPAPTHLITGMPGVGKSALALQLAHTWRFRDGTLHADFATTEPAEVLARFLRLLNLPVPSDVEERSALFRMHTNGRKLLVLLDGATSSAQVRQLLPGDGSAALVTSRRTLPALDASRTHLTELTPQEGVQLLRKVIGARVDAEPVAAEEIVTHCAGLPLAVRICAGRLATRPHWPLRTLADLLAPEQTRLDHLICEDLSVRRIIHHAVSTLSDAQRRALATPDIASPELLEQLVDEGLIRPDHTVPALTRLVAGKASRLEAA